MDLLQQRTSIGVSFRAEENTTLSSPLCCAKVMIVQLSDVEMLANLSSRDRGNSFLCQRKVWIEIIGRNCKIGGMMLNPLVEIFLLDKNGDPRALKKAECVADDEW